MISFGRSLLGEFFQFVVVDGFGFLGHAVRNDLVRLAGKIQMMPVRKMPAMREIQPENGIARLQHRGVGLHVGLRSRMRLNVGMLRTEQLLRPVARQVLDDIGKLAPAVIALAGISLGILVREHRPRSFEHSLADEILRGDQFESFVLAASLVVDGGGNLRIVFVQRTVHR